MDASMYGGEGEMTKASGAVPEAPSPAWTAPFQPPVSAPSALAVDPLACLPGVRAVVAALAAESDEDLRWGGPDRLAEQVLALQRARELLEAQLLRRVAVMDATDAHRVVRARSVKGFLAQHAQLTDAHARDLVDRARRLRQVPPVAAAFAAGALSADQAATITRDLVHVQDQDLREQGACFLLDQAPRLHLPQLSRVSRELRARLSLEDEREPAPRRTWVRLAATGTSDDPFWVLSGELSATCGEKLRTALEAVMADPTPTGPRATASGWATPSTCSPPPPSTAATCPSPAANAPT
ncbi:DUF222 domain-containing protein [Streptacidiphilus monticola]